MSWECYNKMKCNNCGFVFNVEESTLTMNTKDYNKCPKCHSEAHIVETNSVLEAIDKQKELFKKRKKRIIL